MLGNAFVRIRPDTTGFESEASNTIGGAFKKIAGVAAAAFAAAGVADFGKQIINLASEAEQSIGGVDAVFKQYAASVQQKSKEADRALGLSANSYRELATLIGSQLKNAGVPLDQLGVKTDGLISQGADLAAMFGGTTADAVSALSSALKGEMDPIEKYGISLNSTALEAEAAAMGMTVLGGKLDNSQKAMAVMSLVSKQSGDALGAFGREADTAAGRQQRATAQWENLKTALGDKLLPVWSGLMDFVGTKAIPGMQRVGEVVGQAWNVMFKGDFTGGPLQEDSAVVNALFKIHDGFTLVKDIAAQAFNILFKGDFNGGPLSEDSGLVSALFNIREGFITLKDIAGQVFNVLFKGDFTGGPLSEDSPLVASLFKVREGFEKVREIAVQAFNVLFKGEYSGGPLSEDSALLRGLAALRENFQKVSGFIAEHFKPAIQEVAKVVGENLLPVLMLIGNFLIDTFTPTWEALVDFYDKHLAPAVEKIVKTFMEWWPEIKQVALIIGGLILVIEALAYKIVGWLLPILIKVAGFLVDTFADAITGTIEIIFGIVRAINKTVEGFVWLYDKAVWLGEKINDAFGWMRDKAVEIWQAMAAWVTERFDAMRTKVAEIAGNIRDWVVDRFNALRDKAGSIWSEMATAVSDLFNALRARVAEIADVILAWVSEKFTALKDRAIGIFTALRDFVTGIWSAFRDTVVSIAQNIWDWIVLRFEGLKARAIGIWTETKDNVSLVFTTMRDTLVNIAQNIWDWIVQRFTALRDRAVGIFTGIRDTVSGVWTGFRDNLVNTAQNIFNWVVDKFESMKNRVVDIFTKVRDTVGAVWDSVLDKVKAPVRVVVGFINDKVIGNLNKVTSKFGLDIPKMDMAFATGGIVPGGYAPGRDTQLAAVSPGEAFMRPEWTRAVGADYIHAANRAARTGGVSGVQAFLANGGPAFANGGIVGNPSRDTGGPLDVIGDIAGSVKDKAVGAFDWTTDKIQGLLAKGAGFALKTLLSPVAGWITSNVTDNEVVRATMAGGFRDVVAKAEAWGNTKDVEAAASAAAAGGGFSGSAAMGGGAIGGGWQTIFANVQRAFPQANNNSAYRPGDSGYHGRGKAVDLGQKGRSGGMGHPYLADMNRFLYDNYGSQLAELIYDGAGDDRPDILNGRPHTYSASTRRDHYNHVHAAVYDSGGVLEPGTTIVQNKSGKPEGVLTNKELGWLHSAAANGSGGPLVGALTIQVGNGASVKDGLDETMFQLRRLKRGSR